MLGHREGVCMVSAFKVQSLANQHGPSLDALCISLILNRQRSSVCDEVEALAHSIGVTQDIVERMVMFRYSHQEEQQHKTKLQRIDLPCAC